jgi:hypothetical protein
MPSECAWDVDLILKLGPALVLGDRRPGRDGSLFIAEAVASGLAAGSRLSYQRVVSRNQPSFSFSGSGPDHPQESVRLPAAKAVESPAEVAVPHPVEAEALAPPAARQTQRPSEAHSASPPSSSGRRCP